MKPKVRKVAVIVGTSAVFGVAGFGGASTAARQSAGGARGAPDSQAQAQAGPDGGLDPSALAAPQGSDPGPATSSTAA
jgi:hypothetical protein